MKRTLLAVLACFAVTGCGDKPKHQAAAESQAAIFHQQFNDEDLAAIVTTAHPEMVEESSESEITQFLGDKRAKLGKVTGSKTVNYGIRTMNAVTKVVLVRETTFENGKGTEKFTFRIQNDKALLRGYRITEVDLSSK